VALLAQGADVNATGNDGSTALMAAKREGHKEIIRILKEAGVKEWGNVYILLFQRLTQNYNLLL
jgi:ankyrin repeat protein